jgi:hypothetical protein
MSFLGGILKSVINPATLFQLAMGPAGWAAMAARTIGMAIGQQVIQQLGQRLGLPQGVINMAQSAFSMAAGQPGAGVRSIGEAVSELASQFNLSPAQAGQMERDSNASLNRILGNIGRRATGAEEEGSTGSGGAAGAGGKKSFLVALAEAMGALMDQKAAQMEKLAGEITSATDGGKAGFINGVDGSKNSSEATKLSSKTALLQAYGQELGILSNAFSQVAKSFGDAQTTNARKG